MEAWGAYRGGGERSHPGGDQAAEADQSGEDAGGGGGAAPAPPELAATDGPDLALETGRVGRVSGGLVDRDERLRQGLGNLRIKKVAAARLYSHEYSQ